MNRNSQQHFTELPEANIQRSTFHIPFNHKTTFNTQELIPFYMDMDVLPGDTFNISTSFVCRLMTPIYPTMDNMYIDFYYFAIPYRILWEHWKEFNGENILGTWAQTTEYSIPQMKFSSAITKGSIFNYLGLPQGTGAGEVSAIPYRAYLRTYSEFFRDQNYIAPPEGAYDVSDVTKTWPGNKPPEKVSRFHDYFSSVLPQPQKGEAITLPIGEKAPVISNGNAFKVSATSGGDGTTLRIDRDPQDTTLNHVLSNGVNYANPLYWARETGLQADLTSAIAATINAQRQAFALQRILEKDARGGTRYREILLNHFGVVSPDARQQIPEYLGGKRVPIAIDQVTQTSSTDTTSPQGNTAGMSITGDSDEENGFTKSFTEHCVLLGLLCVRTDRSYAQGVNRAWKRKRRFDFYLPTLANLGEQPVFNYEIYAQGTEEDNEVWGYQERWAEYRYKPNLVTGALAPNYEQSLDPWIYVDNYGSLPVMSKDWLESGKENVDNTIAVTSQLENQFIADILVDIKATRPMPVYSVPGLIDHF